MSKLDQEFLDEMKQRIEAARKTIKVVETIEKLQAFALGEELKGKPVFMDKEQLKAADIILRKSMPDLKAIEITGAGGGPVEVSLVESLKAARERAGIKG